MKLKNALRIVLNVMKMTNCVPDVKKVICSLQMIMILIAASKILAMRPQSIMLLAKNALLVIKKVAQSVMKMDLVASAYPIILVLV